MRKRIAAATALLLLCTVTLILAQSGDDLFRQARQKEVVDGDMWERLGGGVAGRVLFAQLPVTLGLEDRHRGTPQTRLPRSEAEWRMLSTNRL